jgi:FeoA domain
MPPHATSLAELAPGEAATIRQILFDTLRTHCAESGLHEGDRVTRLEDGGLGGVRVAVGGTARSCPVEYARFVEVAPDHRRRGAEFASSRGGRESPAVGDRRRHVHSRGSSLGGDCVCLGCGARRPHQRGAPCLEERCPNCHKAMVREGSAPHLAFLARQEKSRKTGAGGRG